MRQEFKTIYFYQQQTTLYAWVRAYKPRVYDIFPTTQSHQWLPGFDSMTPPAEVAGRGRHARGAQGGGENAVIVQSGGDYAGPVRPLATGPGFYGSDGSAVELTVDLRFVDEPGSMMDGGLKALPTVDRDRRSEVEDVRVSSLWRLRALPCGVLLIPARASGVCQGTLLADGSRPS